MANPVGGNWQQLLLEGAQNGRLKTQTQHKTAPQSTSESQTANRRDDYRFPLHQGSVQTSRRHGKPPGGAPFTSSSNAQVPRPTLTSQRTAVIPPTWSCRKSASLVIRGVPASASPWDIRQYFKRFGKVVWVEVDDASRGVVRSAKVRFEPPPTDSSFFQHGQCFLSINGTVSRVLIEFPRQSSDEPTFSSPLGNKCPCSLALEPKQVTFGLLIQPTTFMCKKRVEKLEGEFNLRFTADFKRMKLVIHFPVQVGRDRQYYRADIKFGIIRKIYRMAATEERSALLITVEDPPLIRRKHFDAAGNAWADRLVWGEDELWQRAVEVKPQSQNPKAEPVSLDEEPDIIDLGRWTTYWLDLDAVAHEQWTAIETHLHDWNIKTHLDTGFTQVAGRSPKLWEMLDDPLVGMSTGAAISLWSNDLALLSSTGKISLPFDVRYQLEVCLSRGILCEYNIERDFLERLVELSRADGLDSNRARLILEYAADKGKPIYDPMDLFKNRGAMAYYPTSLHVPDYCVLVRKVSVTPTRIYFSTPAVETSNRIIRHYKQVQDYFIRVQFTDELLDGRIRACEVDRDDELYTRIYRVMMHGIRMGRWHWKFLAFGNSQIRESGAFFFSQTEAFPGITCDSIRQWMGNFSHIPTVAKLAARLGQCFSTTRLLRCIFPRIVKIPDVEKNGFCYTDGVGKISMSLATLVSQEWKIYPPPSAFQFRMGGCKGVLVTWPDAKGTEVHIRPSQEKFSAEYNGLEIIRCSQFSCATLNRQTIIILSCLGVPDDVFTDMMQSQISNYNAAMTDKDKAVELLRNYVDENMTTTTIASMVLSGFMHTKEPFVRTMLQLWRSWSIKAMKEKARLVVDQGAFVLGCADETGSLRGHSRATEGHSKIRRDHLPQIFLQVPDANDRGAYKVITGLCLVGRNPSLHPGDIRVVEAVDLPQLRHLRDVVVFPLNGDQDVASMCSGGDLDGDDFFVIWDPKLLPTEWSHPPMNYSAPKLLTEPKASTAKSLATFFVLFMKNDRLPLIAHAHLATADKEVEGAKHRKCLQLAELHSTAVDYVKTGVPAEWNKKLDPRKYPHFMEKPGNKTYRSTGVLGKLYDMVDRAVFDSKDNYTLPFDDRVLSRFQPMGSNLLKKARKIKTQYDIAIRRIMGQLEIRTEFEVWSTFVMTKPRVGSDYKVQEKVGREAAGLKKQFRDLCLKTVEEQGFDRLEFVAAMYRVTWEETRIALYEARQKHVLPDGTVGLRRISAWSMPLLSFPWLFPDELGRIALHAEREPTLDDFGVKPATSAKSEPKVIGDVGERLETAVDLAAMDYMRTSDGQVIHRGEILHLFRHEDEEVEGFYCSDGVAGSGLPVNSAFVKESEGEINGSSSTDETRRSESPAFVSPDTALNSEVGISSASSAVSPVEWTTSPEQGVWSFQKTTDGSDHHVPDLLSSDTDSHSEFAPCLTPDIVVAEEQCTRKQDIDKTEKAAQPSNNGFRFRVQTDTPVQLIRDPTPRPNTQHSPEAEFSPLKYIKLSKIINTYSHSLYTTTPTLYNPWERASAYGSAFNTGISSLSQKQAPILPWTGGPDPYLPVPAGENRNGGNGGGNGTVAAESSDGEVEYEEEVLEVEVESALERAEVRFA